ncbi:MAG: metallophosphoesterase [Actinomycetota bacterium]
MSFSTQLLVFAIVVGAVFGFALEPVWRDARPSPRRLGMVAAVMLAAVAWAATLTFFGVAHLAYLLATVVPAVVLFTIAINPLARFRLATRPGRLVYLILLLPPIAGLYASHIEPFWLRVDHVTVANDAGAGLRVGVLADLQTTGIGDYERDAVAQLIDEDPDLVVIPGDLWQVDADYIAVAWPQWAELISDLVDAVGTVVMIEGNTDHIGFIERIADESGAVVLHDRVERFEIDGTTVVIGGTRDLALQPAGPSLAAMRRLAAAETDEVVTIALSHRPDIAFWLPGPVDLVISGHTHGGQIQLPVLGPIMTASAVSRDVAAGGLHEVNGNRIYVSTGVGRERGDAPQVRFGARPSIGVLDFSEASG